MPPHPHPRPHRAGEMVESTSRHSLSELTSFVRLHESSAPRCDGKFLSHRFHNDHSLCSISLLVPLARIFEQGHKHSECVRLHHLGLVLLCFRRALRNLLPPCSDGKENGGGYIKFGFICGLFQTNCETLSPFCLWYESRQKPHEPQPRWMLRNSPNTQKSVSKPFEANIHWRTCNS